MPKNKQNKKPQSLLRNPIHFPTFNNLPEDYEVDLNYYEETEFGFEPHQHWCFLGEIVDFLSFGRVVMHVKDKIGRVIMIALYTEDNGQAIAPQVKKGHTVAVLYGEQHHFLDMSVGIRVEQASSIKIIPCSLDQLLKASDEVATRKGQPRRCGSCGREESQSENRQLRLCARCKQASYCGEDCQRKAWFNDHKADCKALLGVQWFTARDWRRFHGGGPNFHDWFNF